MIAANGLSVLMDSAVVVIAFLLTRPWGRRVPAWLLALPMWAATGLLLPIMTGYPLQLLVSAVGAGGEPAPGASTRAFVDEWVFGVVHSGFIVQGLPWAPSSRCTPGTAGTTSGGARCAISRTAPPRPPCGSPRSPPH
ncbi:hypothetical protein ACFWNI_11030 [Streptomyces sp. NPDC058377]|uniref:hypothetical protein n=1 Tax=Streptomyces sp. NPDC058377 TaxID=3346468 RepID=UPI0036668E72